MTAFEKYRSKWEAYGYFNHERVIEAEIVDSILREHFTLDRLECIETGCTSNTYDNFGLYLLDFIEERGGGSFSTVDNNPDLLEKSRSLLGNRASFHCGDSVEFLRNYSGSPTLVHLDSWDLDVINPMPSMLHGWLEFEAIKEKVPSGGIVLIDDNYFEGTQLSWLSFFDGQQTSNREVNFEAEITGKGSLIYHWIKNYKTDWIIISEKRMGSNVKLIVKKL